LTSYHDTFTMSRYVMAHQLAVKLFVASMFKTSVPCTTNSSCTRCLHLRD